MSLYERLSMLPQKFITIARSYIGTPYLHQGRSRTGMDCAGLVILAVKSAQLLPSGFEDELPANYGRDGNGQLELIVSQYCQPIPQPVPAALLLFKAVPTQTVAQHCAIISNWDGGLGMIHAYENAGSVREHQLIQFWESRIMGCYKLPGIVYQ